MSDTYNMPEHGWTCFHCGETFTTPGAAREHFGPTPNAEPGCVIKVQPGGERGLLSALRKAEKELAAYRDEDQTLAREITAMQSRHYDALMSAEEAGYARGLRDFMKVEQQRNRLLIALKRCKFDSLNMTLDDWKYIRSVVIEVESGQSQPNTSVQAAVWTQPDAIKAAHAAGLAGTSWIMGPEELAHLLNAVQLMSNAKVVVHAGIIGESHTTNGLSDGK